MSALTGSAGASPAAAAGASDMPAVGGRGGAVGPQRHGHGRPAQVGEAERGDQASGGWDPAAREKGREGSGGTRAGRGGAGEDFEVESAEGGHVLFDGEEFQGPGAGGGAEPGPAGGVVQQREAGAGEGVRVARGDDQAGAADDLADGADVR
ncbi:hypothetical protein GCM10020000_27760 [Streptomyces olivoverticillatus]